MTLIDTNVLLDVFTNDPTWAGWSISQLDAATLRGRLAINDVIYAELSVRFAAIETLDAVLRAASVSLSRCRVPLYFSPARRSYATAPLAADEAVCCLTSLSGRMRLSRACHCLLEMRSGTAATFPPLIWLHQLFD